MINEKYIKLINLLKTYKKVTLAYSGGVDSNFLLHACQEALGHENVLAVTIAGDMNPEKERNESISYAKNLNVEHIIVPVDIYNIEKFKENPVDRCYYCKRQIFKTIKEISKDNSISVVLDGTNEDDHSDYRPGLKAIKELEIKSPLKEVGLTKAEIRELSKIHKVATWNKPSMACLASRIPYNTEITREKLNLIEECEDFLDSLGYSNYRVRYHDNIARIELDKNSLHKFIESNDFEKVNKYFKDQGFIYVTLDLEGFKSGSMNVGLKDKEV